MPIGVAGKLYEISRRTEYLYLDDVWITGFMRLKHVTAMYNDAEDILIDTLLDPAPLSLRNDQELRNTGKDLLPNIIVLHAWGNILLDSVDVSNMIRHSWKEWRNPSQL